MNYAAHRGALSGKLRSKKRKQPRGTFRCIYLYVLYSPIPQILYTTPVLRRGD